MALCRRAGCTTVHLLSPPPSWAPWASHHWCPAAPHSHCLHTAPGLPCSGWAPHRWVTKLPTTDFPASPPTQPPGTLLPYGRALPWWRCFLCHTLSPPAPQAPGVHQHPKDWQHGAHMAKLPRTPKVPLAGSFCDSSRPGQGHSVHTSTVREKALAGSNARTVRPLRSWRNLAEDTRPST